MNDKSMHEKSTKSKYTRIKGMFLISIIMLKPSHKIMWGKMTERYEFLRSHKER